LRFRQVVSAFLTLFLVAGANTYALAESFGSPLEMDSTTLLRGMQHLKDTPRQISNLEELALGGKQFETEQACLGYLQLTLASSRMIANALPFSSVEAFEGDLGPTASIRIMFNGKKISFTAHCEGEKMVVRPLDWTTGMAATLGTPPSTLDSAIGMLLLLNAQGYFDGNTEARAPKVSDRPQSRPPEPSQTNGDPVADAVSRAVSSAASDGGETITALAGEPLTEFEMDQLRVAVNACWNVGSMTMEALRTTVTVRFNVNSDGRPDASTIELVASDGGSGTALTQAFETARRAIVRCGARGFPLPPEKYATWQTLEIVFDPDEMRVQ
jgi:hypothetical protein